MKTTISIIICKTITKICHIFGRDGSVFPGSIAHKIEKKALWKLKYPKYVIGVTGSSGKGSTVNMLAHILKEANKKVIWNNNGSNIDNAIITLILNNTNAFSHKVNADVILLELDERFINGLFKAGTITHLALTNITRDQPARNEYPEFIYNAILNSLDNKMHLIINADDPILNRVKKDTKCNITTYGLDKTKYSLTTAPLYGVDAAYCPKCKTKLDYSYYHYGHIGSYKCPKCDFSRGKIDYEGTKLDLNLGTYKINGKDIKLNKKVFFAAYYTLCSYAIASTIGIDEKDIVRALNVDTIKSKRLKEYSLDNRTVEMLESKNENALSYLQSLNYIKMQKGKKTVIMGFENVSRRYEFNDLSWLWDVDFELLNDKDVDKIFCIGRFKYDVKTRLEYAGIDAKKIVLIDDMNTLVDRLRNESEGNIYTMVCFDMTQILKDLLKENMHEKNN